MADIQLIREALASKAYPITAAYIAQLKNLDKSAVNRLLHANPTQFEKLECQPPLWRVLPATVSTVAEIGTHVPAIPDTDE
jgi:hypothetical protein